MGLSSKLIGAKCCASQPKMPPLPLKILQSTLSKKNKKSKFQIKKLKVFVLK